MLIYFLRDTESAKLMRSDLNKGGLQYTQQ